MKRVVALFLVMVMSVLFIPAMAEGYQSTAYVKVTTCTLRNEAKDDTSASNRMAKMENGYTMTVIGESDGYYVILPSSVCDRAGNNLGLSDDTYGFVKKGHIKLGAKQFVVLTERAILYDDRTESDENEIGELSAGQEVLLIKAEQNWDGSLWYKVQLHDNSAGLAYMPARFGYIKESAQLTAEEPKQPEVVAQQEVVVSDDSTFEPDIEEEVYQEELTPQDTTKQTAEGLEYAYASKKATVYSDANRTVKLGVLQPDEETQVIRVEGLYTVIVFYYNGIPVEGYVLTEMLYTAKG